MSLDWPSVRQRNLDPLSEVPTLEYTSQAFQIGIRVPDHEGICMR